MLTAFNAAHSIQAGCFVVYVALAEEFKVSCSKFKVREERGSSKFNSPLERYCIAFLSELLTTRYNRSVAGLLEFCKEEKPGEIPRLFVLSYPRRNRIRVYISNFPTAFSHPSQFG